MIKNKYLNKKLNRYYLNTDNGLIQESHYIYCKHNNLNKIPKGYDIHHIDNNPLNNVIDNLELIERSEHGTLSMNTNLVGIDWEQKYIEFKNGKSKENIAKEIGCSVRSINRNFKKRGYDNIKINLLNLAEIKKRFLNGESKKKLAIEYRCSRKYLDKKLGNKLMR